MSSRALKKLSLQGVSDILKVEEDSTTDDDLSTCDFNNKKFNRYSLLNDDTQSESEVKENDNETTESVNATESGCDTKDIKRKKKKKKRRSNRQYYYAGNSEDNVEDEVERSVREVNQLLGDEKKTETEKKENAQSCTTYELSYLKVEARHLNPNNEFKRMFGSKIVNTSAEFKRKSRGRSIKNTVIVLPKDAWMSVTKQGISMKLFEKDNYETKFTFEHSHSYQEIQKEFLAAVSSLTPDDIITIVNDYPYHIDALIQLSELCKVAEDHAMAAELIERAVYALEMAFHPSFNVCRGDCRLSYIRQENRSFYVAVLKHIQFVGQKACYRTALELSKMLLSLNPSEDPLALVLSIDYYALRAKEYKWFIDFTNAWNPCRNLLKLPNFKYSIAVAHWYLNNFEEADKCLQEALLLFPSCLIRLANKCSIQLDPKVQTHSFFTTFADSTETKALTCLIALYVERCHHVWKTSELLPWLEKNVHEVLKMVDTKCPEMADSQTKRMTWFKPSLPVNIKRHLVIYDLTEILALSGERMPNTILHFDPYPPTNSVNLYSVPRRSILNPSRRTGILASFFHALNPNIHYEGPDEHELDELADEIGEVNQELRRSLRSIVNSIRGLLTTFDTTVGTSSATSNQVGTSTSTNRATQTSTESEGNTLGEDAENTETSPEENNAP